MGGLIVGILRYIRPTFEFFYFMFFFKFIFVLFFFCFRRYQGRVTRGNFSCNFSRNKGCVASCKKNFTCNTPFLQPAMRQNVALQVAKKV